MARWGFSGDEVWGVFSIGALCAGDIEEAAKILSRARLGYAVGFLLRLALVAPGLAMRTGWWIFVSVLKESVRAVELTGCWRNSGVSRVVRRIVARPADSGNGGAERVVTAGAGADGANREFGKMIAQGGHVTPSVDSNPLNRLYTDWNSAIFGSCGRE